MNSSPILASRARLSSIRALPGLQLSSRLSFFGLLAVPAFLRPGLTHNSSCIQDSLGRRRQKRRTVEGIKSRSWQARAAAPREKQLTKREEATEEKGRDKVRNLKARLVVRGDQGRLIALKRGYDGIVNYHDTEAPTASREAQSIFYTIAASRKWHLRSMDVPRAFLQGEKGKMRKIHIIPPKEARSTPGKVWKPLLPIYGFDDAPRHFYLSIKEELEKMGGEAHPLDPCFFVFRQMAKKEQFCP